MQAEMTPQEQLDSLSGYYEHLTSKYDGLGMPSYYKGLKRPNKMQMKEIERVRETLDKLERCKRHNGLHGLNCNMCSIEDSFNKIL